MLLMLTLQPALAERVRALVQLDEQGLHLLDAVRVEGEARALGPTVQGDVRVLDEQGRVLGQAGVPDFRERSALGRDGHEGELVRLSSASGWVEVDWPEGAARIDLEGQQLAPRVPPPGAAVAVLESGSDEARLDMVFLGDGYTAAEQDLYAADVQRMTDYLLSIDPYGSYSGLFNVWRVDAPSADSGVDHPSQAVYRDTAYGCYYDCGGIERLICCQDSLVLNEVEAALPGADGILVLINDPQYGGAGGFSYATSYTDGRTGEQVAAHELGHSLVGLWDEYSYGVDYSGEGPNCARDGDEPPWSHWLDVDGVDAFKPCSYTSLHRPTQYDCMMNSLQDDYCPVCREQAVLAIYEQIPGLVAQVSPDQGAVDVRGVTRFEATLLGPDDGSLEAHWLLDGVEVGAGPELDLPGCDEGERSLKLSVWDPTEWVRADPAGLLQDEATWTLQCHGQVDTDELDSGSPARPRAGGGGPCGCMGLPDPRSIGLFGAILVAVLGLRRLN
jgi:hypothetical protein